MNEENNQFNNEINNKIKNNSGKVVNNITKINGIINLNNEVKNIRNTSNEFIQKVRDVYLEICNNNYPNIKDLSMNIINLDAFISNTSMLPNSLVSSGNKIVNIIKKMNSVKLFIENNIHRINRTTDINNNVSLFTDYQQQLGECFDEFKKRIREYIFGQDKVSKSINAHLHIE
ncbi:hypothetical protein [Lentilactobacillus hilgardii]|uniref:hypothetical protein n=1 Tax=Lentilactobacillus hilgardii TaxID=1588 RepID=UPI0021A8515E|nr:hypothetical protein [Lentilactobacillus hilgardii]MCT3398883.1 hypothetical protein [Lentilactobacillus hilgardii]